MAAMMSQSRVKADSHLPLGLGPSSMQPGDSIFLVRGSRTPLVFRFEELGCALVGDCYVCGIMQGEAFREEKCEPFIVV